MKKTNLFFILLFTALVVGCGSSVHTKDFFLKTEKIGPEYEYLGSVTVNKEGFYFLWFIPFASNSEETAKALLIKKARSAKGFPDADGICELQIERESVGFFRWAPNTIVKGKAVKRRY